MLNLEYIFTKFDYFYFFFIFLFLFIILLHLEIFNYANIIPLTISLLIVFFFVKKYYYNEINNFYKASLITSKIDYSQYPYLNIDQNLILVIIDLKDLFSENTFEYRKLLRSLNNFFMEFKKLEKNPDNQGYDILFDYSKNSLNIINSIGVNNDFDKNNVGVLVEKEHKVKNILSKYITQIEILINNKWFTDKTNNMMKPIYPDEINGFTKDSHKYNLY